MKNTRIVVALLATLALSAGFLSAFELFDPPGKWLSGDLPRDIQVADNGHNNVADADGGVTEIVDAIANSWNAAVPGSVTSTTVTSGPPASIGDGISTMHFTVAGTGCSGTCLGVTFTPTAYVGSETVNGISFGGFTDSDIFFNTSGKFYSSSEPDGCRREYHIESVAVHEVGHLLGLGHTPVAGATMFATTGQCDSGGETLAQDDIDGINCIYNNGYGCNECVGDTLVVDRTNCDQPSSGPNAGDFVVETFIVDNCGAAVAGADVTIDIPTSPIGFLSCSGTTSSTGRLGCALDNPDDGLYESLVSAVSHTSFPAWSGNECGGVGQPPCGCSIEIGGCVPTSNKEKGPKCSNGLDDDCDGLIDGADPDC